MNIEEEISSLRAELSIILDALIRQGNCPEIEKLAKEYAEESIPNDSGGNANLQYLGNVNEGAFEVPQEKESNGYVKLMIALGYSIYSNRGDYTNFLITEKEGINRIELAVNSKGNVIVYVIDNEENRYNLFEGVNFKLHNSSASIGLETILRIIKSFTRTLAIASKNKES